MYTFHTMPRNAGHAHWQVLCDEIYRPYVDLGTDCGIIRWASFEECLDRNSVAGR